MNKNGPISPRRPGRINSLALLALLLLSLPGAIPRADAAPLYRPEKAQRTLNTDLFVLSIQKDNRVDIHTLNGLPVLRKASPYLTLADKAPRPLRVDYRRSERVSINNALGQGNGLLFTSPECEWRIATYPGMPFITVELTYINATKKSVTVAGLSPLTAEETGAGAVFVGPPGTGPVTVLQHGTADTSVAPLIPSTERVDSHVAALNLATGDNLIAGFITHGPGEHRCQLTDARPAPSVVFDRFLSLSRWKEPVVVAPGERLSADTLYFAIQEEDVYVGLNRFAAAANRMDPYPTLPHRVRHGWLADPARAWDGVSLQAVMDRLAGDGARQGWSHVHLGTAWMAASGGLAPDRDRFPRGLAALAAYAHERGLTLGITVPFDGLDPVPVAAFIADANTAAVDSIEVAYVPAATATGHPRELYGALDAVNYAGPQPVYVRPHSAAAPASLRDWALASRLSYLPQSGNPLLAGPGLSPLQDTSSLTDTQFVTALSLAALQGALLRPATPYFDQSPLRRQVLAQLLPGTAQPAIPVDLFGADAPSQWYMSLKAAAGTWTVLGIFNWDEAGAAVRQTPLSAFGLNRDVRYTVYDFWAGQYLGNIMGELSVEVPAGGVRLLGLRYAEQQPMLVATNRDFTQGATDHTELTWSHETQRLTGRFRATPAFPYTLTFHIPEPYRLKDIECGVPVTRQSAVGPSLQIAFTAEEGGDLTWALQF